MDLEKKAAENRPGFFKRIVKRAAKRAIPYIFSAGLVISPIIGCKESPGPISVESTIRPSTVQSGGNVYWDIEVTNHGGKVTIDKVFAQERVIGGWGAGMPGSEASMNIPITDNEIDAHSTETVFSISTPVYNIPPYGTPSHMYNLTIENTVTVESDGGDDSDACTYTILPSYIYSSSSSNQAEVKKESARAEGIIRILSEK